MTTHQDEVSRYLTKLADGLGALGPAETQEVLAEVRSHIQDSLSETGEDSAVVLARFGSPEALAMRILEERGILPGTSALPDAPAWMRRTALALDILVTVFLLVMSAALIAAIMWLATSIERLGWPLVLMVALMPPAALCLFWAIARWCRARRASVTTVGLGLMGLRRLRIGQSDHLIRKRDLPGVSVKPWDRLHWGLRFACLLVVLAVLGCAVTALAFALTQHTSVTSGSVALMEAPYAVMAMDEMSDFYESVTTGSSTQDIRDRFGPQAPEIAASLLARRHAGKLSTYRTGGSSLAEYFPAASTDTSLHSPSEQLLLTVDVVEYPQGSYEGMVYRYVLAWTFTGIQIDRSVQRIEGTLVVVSCTAEDDDQNLPAH